MMAGPASDVTLRISEQDFDGADKLTLIEKCDPFLGGGNYMMKEYEGKEINQMLWLCQVTEFVFGYLPQEIFVKREKA
jgi:hypothetical protein